jgi:putative DNA primase/helicase
MEITTPKDYALRYLQMGFSVFPLRNEPASERKRPALSWEPYQNRHPSIQEIEGWGKEFNLAIVTGNISKNLIAIDVDGSSVKRLEDKLPEMSQALTNALANTMVNRSGGGGTHIVFRLSEQTTVDISQKTIWKEPGHSEIKIQGNGHFIVAAPSLHPNGNRYVWNGKEPVEISKGLLDEFIRLVGNGVCNENELVRKRTSTETLGEETRVLNPEEMQQLLAEVKPCYSSGARNDIVYHLPAAMRKEGIMYSSTRMFVTLLCNAAGDSTEDRNRSLEKVDRTYSLPLEEINGKKGLSEFLISIFGEREGFERFSKICQCFNAPIFLEGQREQQLVQQQLVALNNIIELDDSTPGAWLKRQIEADKDVEEDIIGTIRREVMRLARFRTLEDSGEMRYYHEGTFIHGGGDRGENKIKQLIEHLGGDMVSSHVESNIIRHVRNRTLTPRSEFNKEYYLLNCKNCVIDLRTGLTYPHDADKYLFTQQIPWDYKPNEDFKTPKKTLHLMYNLMHPADVVKLLEHIGHCLITNSSLFQKAVMLAGPPDQGKSKIMGLIQALLGKQNVSNMTLHQLVEDKHARAELFGKLANVFADLESERLRNISFFKTIVSGDIINARHLYENTFNFPPYAKLIYSANQPPLPSDDLADEDDAYFRRWDVIGVNRRKTCFFNQRTKYSLLVKDRCPLCAKTNGRIEKDATVLERILEDKEEMEGLLYLAIKSAMRLLDKGGFTHRPDIETIREEYLRKAEPVKAWVDARCVISRDYTEGVDRERLFADFEEHCYSNKLIPTNVVHLGRKLRKLYGEGIIGDKYVGPKKGPRKHHWTGIMLREDLREAGQLGLDEREKLEEEVKLRENGNQLQG